MSWFSFQSYYLSIYCKRARTIHFMHSQLNATRMYVYQLNDKAFHHELNEPQPAVNFINVLCARFWYENLLISFFLLRVWLWTNCSYEKSARKTLMKLTPGRVLLAQQILSIWAEWTLHSSASQPFLNCGPNCGQIR